MLDIRPNCEACDKNLPPESTEAYICTYECTFCRDCAIHLLKNVCPNCGGGFCPRPIRPKIERRAGVSLSHQPASSARVKSKYTRAEMVEFSEAVKDVVPEVR